MRTTGVVLLVLAFLFILRPTALSVLHPNEQPHMEGMEHAPPDPPWAMAANATLVLAGIMLAVVPVRRGERWALWTTILMFAILLMTRLSTDPRCLQVLDPHKHGCHTFMLGMVFGFVGAALAGFSRVPGSR